MAQLLLLPTSATSSNTFKLLLSLNLKRQQNWEIIPTKESLLLHDIFIQDFFYV